jgi:ubiquinone biosynthesis protein UbiJ
MRFDPEAIPAALANRVLARESWARSSLAAHAGRIFTVAVGPIAMTMRIEASGAIEPAPSSSAAPDLKLTLSPLTMPSFLADPTRWDALVRVDGDAALAAALKGLAETLPWFVERAFAGRWAPSSGSKSPTPGVGCWPSPVMRASGLARAWRATCAMKLRLR